jgi:DDE family transposase
MHVARLLSQWLGNHTVIGHRARERALMKLVHALLDGSKLSLTQLGRHRAGSAYEKHHIKAADRLLANRHLHAERDGIYRALARTLLTGIKRPMIIVDWSDLEPRRRWLVIKAAAAVGGRAVSLYEKVYPMKRYNSPRTHREFLLKLKTILPEGCKPIIVTDAGFRGPWFKAVEAHGWDWVGRIRNKIKYYHTDSGRWRYTDTLYKQATTRVQHVGEVSLSPRYRYRFRMYLVRAYKASRRRARRGERAKRPHARTYRRLHKAPWLLATSLPHKAGSSRKIKQLYAQRMQIEETFRDTKSHRWGFGLHYARCDNGRRLEVLLLIAALASLVLWLVGLCGKVLDWSRRLQANTERRRPVLSTVFIGRQLLRRSALELPKRALDLAMAELRALIMAAVPA